MRWSWWWLGSAGCLLAVDVPPGFIDTGTCRPECPGHFACLEGYGCVDSCQADILCAEGYRCDGGDCVPECVDEDCFPFLCRDSAACESECVADGQCAEGRSCCTEVKIDRGDCKKKDLGACVKP